MICTLTYHFLQELLNLWMLKSEKHAGSSDLSVAFLWLVCWLNAYCSLELLTGPLHRACSWCSLPVLEVCWARGNNLSIKARHMKRIPTIKTCYRYLLFTSSIWYKSWLLLRLLKNSKIKSSFLKISSFTVFDFSFFFLISKNKYRKAVNSVVKTSSLDPRFFKK